MGIIYSYFVGYYNVSSIIAYAYSCDLINVYSGAYINGTRYCGGIIGYDDYSNISNALFYGTMAATDSYTCGPMISEYSYNPTKNEFINCYYYKDGTTLSSVCMTGVTLDQIKSGEIAYKLNNGVTDGSQVFYQTVGQGAPSFSGLTVYAGYENCLVENLSYYNKEVYLTKESAHKVNEEIGVLFNDTQHYNKCSVCNNDVYFVNHSFTDVCDNNCNDNCGYVRQAPHNFTLNEYDEINHFTKCSICKIIDDTSVKNHTFDNLCDTNCNDNCGYVRSVEPHEFAFTQDSYTVVFHWKVCVNCGIEDINSNGTHTFDDPCDTTCNDGCLYSRTPSHINVWDNNNETHWIKCSRCNFIDETTIKEHYYSNICDTTCDSHCGFTRSVEPHEYEYENSEHSHIKKCINCDTYDLETQGSHTYSNQCDTTCNDNCGYVRSVEPHTFIYDYQSYNETEHWKFCQYCGFIDETSRLPHSFSELCYETSCLENCGFHREIVHDFSKIEFSEIYHWIACIRCGSGKDNSNEFHSFSNRCDTTCDGECGYVRSVEPHNFVVEILNDTHHHEVCSYCEESQNLEEHSYSKDCDSRCDTCSYVRKVEHSYNEGFCMNCGLEL
ncbi:MAG: hypothetical protein IJW82_03155, partial [Clostridia bacterium]|nr:hypothetical protein [Clostridia bacterium]